MNALVPSIVIGVVGTSLGLGMIYQTVIGSCSKTFELLSYFRDYHSIGLEDVESLITHADLQCRLVKVGLLMNELRTSDTKSEVIRQSLIDIQDAIDRINANLLQIKKIHQDYEDLYFSSWRMPKCDYLLESLKHNLHLFELRFRDLIDFYRCLQCSKVLGHPLGSTGSTG